MTFEKGSSRGSVNPKRLFVNIFVTWLIVAGIFQTLILGRSDWGYVAIETLFSASLFAAWATWKRKWLFGRVAGLQE
jgi:hypothetical protein